MSITKVVPYHTPLGDRGLDNRNHQGHVTLNLITATSTAIISTSLFKYMTCSLPPHSKHMDEHASIRAKTATTECHATQTRLLALYAHAMPL